MGPHHVFLWRFYQFNRGRRGILEMVKWIGKFSLSLQRLRDAWMEYLPMSALSEEQRRIQYLADVAQEHAERLTRGETIMDPNTRENRERWNTAQMNDFLTILTCLCVLCSTNQKPLLTTFQNLVLVLRQGMLFRFLCMYPCAFLSFSSFQLEALVWSGLPDTLSGVTCPET